jgi:hypothetical protein
MQARRLHPSYNFMCVLREAIWNPSGENGASNGRGCFCRLFHVASFLQAATRRRYPVESDITDDVVVAVQSKIHSTEDALPSELRITLDSPISLQSMEVTDGADSARMETCSSWVDREGNDGEAAAALDSTAEIEQQENLTNEDISDVGIDQSGERCSNEDWIVFSYKSETD